MFHKPIHLGIYFRSSNQVLLNTDINIIDFVIVWIYVYNSHQEEQGIREEGNFPPP